MGTATSAMSSTMALPKRAAFGTASTRSALRFVPYEDLEAEGYGRYRDLLDEI